MNTIRTISVILGMILFVVVSGCSGSNGNNTGELLSGIERLSTVKPGDDLSGYYTSDTMKAAKRYALTHNDTGILDGLDKKIFARKSKWHIASEKREGTRAMVEIVIDAHPSPNMIGLSVIIPLRLEDKRWKIDRAEMIRNLQR